MKVIACIEDHDVNQKILSHLQMNTKAKATKFLSNLHAPGFNTS